ncbi:MAG: gamma-glutamyltransferase, partial [Candidatus Electrothrix sp. AR3]|nr:gamma-glutamyltransferase [Candidatus Electrothrix sp. AR3]
SGKGIMLNNMMGEDDLHSGGFHAEPPGKRVASMMSPAALLKGDQVKLVFGTGGSKRIRTALTQVLTQLVDFDMDLSEAVMAPRMYWDGDEKIVHIEPGFSEHSMAALTERATVNLWDDLDLYFGGVHSVIPGVAGVGDSRRGGSAIVVKL